MNAQKLHRVLRSVERSAGVPLRPNDARAVDAPEFRAGLAGAIKRAPEFAPETWAVAASSAWPIPAATLASPEALAHIAALLTAHCIRTVSKAAKRRARAMLDEFAREATAKGAP